MRSTLCLLLLGLVACGDADAEAEAPEYSLGVCPTLSEGVQSFASGAITYDITVRLPADPAGAPLMFVFHGLGGSAAGIAGPLGVDQLVADGMVVVVPDSGSGAYSEWETGILPEDNLDLQMFYDVLGCAHRGLGIDLDRVFATGMSAGGLWSSYLLLHASEWLAAVAPFSGGFIGYPPTTERQIPVMMTWGGPSDLAQGINFDRTSTDLAYYLDQFGHPLTECVHDRGHWIPDQAPDMLSRFFRNQRWGNDDPFASGLTAEFPSWCIQR